MATGGGESGGGKGWGMDFVDLEVVALRDVDGLRGCDFLAGALVVAIGTVREVGGFRLDIVGWKYDRGGFVLDAEREVIDCRVPARVMSREVASTRACDAMIALRRASRFGTVK